MALLTCNLLSSGSEVAATGEVLQKYLRLPNEEGTLMKRSRMFFVSPLPKWLSLAWECSPGPSLERAACRAVESLSLSITKGS